MLQHAAKDFHIDLSQSYMIGDSKYDVVAGNAAGCKSSYLINTNEPNGLLKTIKQIIDA
jgi:histidinol phosphatase-like enzyme